MGVYCKPSCQFDISTSSAIQSHTCVSCDRTIRDFWNNSTVREI